MEEYRFEHREPLTQRVVLALRVNLKQLKERLWLGRKYKVGLDIDQFLVDAVNVLIIVFTRHKCSC